MLSYRNYTEKEASMPIKINDTNKGKQHVTVPLRNAVEALGAVIREHCDTLPIYRREALLQAYIELVESWNVARSHMSLKPNISPWIKHPMHDIDNSWPSGPTDKYQKTDRELTVKKSLLDPEQPRRRLT